MLARRLARPFTDKQIELAITFADQAVIAIENTRLFEEVQARNRALTEANTQLAEALEQQTATSKILRVISASPTDVLPVFETVAENAGTLCHAHRTIIYRFDGEFLRLAASYSASAELRDFIERNPILPGRQSASGRAALERQVVHVPNLATDAEYPYGWRRDVDPIRTALAVPMLKGDILLGVIFIYRFEVRPFTNKQISLVQTFADQAAIAISSVGLFEQVQARNSELRIALQQQMATSEILGVISRSPTDVQPVLDAVAENAARLCDAEDVSILEEDAANFRVVAYRGSSRLQDFEGAPVSRGSVAGRAILENQLIHVHDIREEPEEEFPISKAHALHVGHRNGARCNRGLSADQEAHT
jgi:two-component system, NtrC family, sensor kinase